ncbi:class F sortase [Actinomycetospora cinnamomea]|uniref:Sortase family protein n=1 Tax=Actinomycetospora cinnamomea TaxID=663609 RepID=A0A2U1FDV1_9PSEU|nr:class F sortase [Actinomycetospora cinnamomea]PVZ10140.1 sortase family protein [Actinomycetospora cinnamomea]
MTRTTRRGLLVAASALALLGVVLAAVGLGGDPGPPRAAAPTGSEAAPFLPTPEPPTPAASSPGSGAPPAGLELPAIGVSTPVHAVGLDPDGTLEVPAPGPRYDEAAWYRGSPTPGRAGSSVIIGHVDSARDGPSVFYDLGRLRPGDRAIVTLADGTRPTFVVEDVRTVPKADFPRLEVYGATLGPELRLITCGGAFDPAAGHYEDNTIVFARLVAG